VVEEVAMLLNAGTCGSEEHCIAACPENAIHMQWIPMKGDQDVGRWMTTERDVGARDDGGLPVDDA
jgi:Na+-translocating ferredoxin:NAD+ oxidoreductase RNF subunit RnfB